MSPSTEPGPRDRLLSAMAEHPGATYVRVEVIDLRAALATPPPPRIDVERLAWAMSKVAYPDPEDAWPNTVKDVKDLYRHQAHAIVKAYEEEG